MEKQQSINWKKILLFIFLSCFISWVVAIGMYLGEMKSDNPLAVLLLGLFMWGPAIAVFIIQKLIYKEPLKNYGLSFSTKKLWSYLYPVPLAILILVVSILLVLVLGNTGLIPAFGQFRISEASILQQFQITLSSLPADVQTKGLDGIGLAINQLTPVGFFLLMFVQSIIAGCTINAIFALGEELGWRGLLQKETQAMGFIKSSLFIGLFWGLWHTPMIMMGHNYPNYPYIGIVVMCLFTMALSPVFTYVRLKSGSTIAPSVLHGLINALPGLYLMSIVGGHELVGSIAGILMVLVGIIITIGIFVFDKTFIRNFKTL